MNFTFNNHLQYSVGGRICGVREKYYEPYTVSVGEIDYEYFLNNTWLDEQNRIAKLVYTELGKDITVMLSGGTDSEIVLRILTAIGVRPRAVFVKFSDESNISELVCANDIANDVGVPLEIHTINLKEFVASGRAQHIADSVHCYQLANLVWYDALIALNLPAVMGSDVCFRRDTNIDKWYYCYDETDSSHMRFSKTYNIPLVSEWFSYTPESIAYFMNEYVIQQLISNKIEFKLYSGSTKNIALNALIPSCIKKDKKHGYEKLNGFMQNTCANLKYNTSNELDLSGSLGGIYVDDLHKMLYGINYANN